MKAPAHAPSAAPGIGSPESNVVLMHAVRSNEESVLDIVDLAVEFATPQGFVRVVDGVSMQLRRGRTVAVVGESGCGKSVTGLSTMGLLPSPPARIASGSARLKQRNGSVVDTLSMPRRDLSDIRGHEIAMIFQEPMTSLNPMQTVGSQVAEPMLIHLGLGKAEAWNRAELLLVRVGIPDARRRLSSYPHELSGGMRQRVMIAMALSCEPGVLIADEPTTALDVTIQAQILEVLREIQRSSDMAILFITHDLGVVAEIAQDVIVMYAGEIAEQGSVEDILSRPAHPYTLGLLRSLPRIDRPQRDRDRFYSIPGQVPQPQDMPSGCRFQPRCAYAIERCSASHPELEEIAEGHKVRCFRWREVIGQ